MVNSCSININVSTFQTGVSGDISVHREKFRIQNMSELPTREEKCYHVYRRFSLTLCRSTNEASQHNPVMKVAGDDSACIHFT